MTLLPDTLRTTLAAAVIALGTVAPVAACSSGFLADLACRIGIIDRPTARALDWNHHENGSPLDRVPEAVLGTIHPGLGTAYEANQAYFHNRPSNRAPLPGPQALPFPEINSVLPPSPPAVGFFQSPASFGGGTAVQPAPQPAAAQTVIATWTFTFSGRD